jgi:hypothetical protein
MHIGVFERDSVSLSNNCSAPIWITHWTQENIIQIILERDEYLVLEIVGTEMKSEKS